MRTGPGGVVSPKSLANLDSEGKGPEGAIQIRRKVAHPVENLMAWLENRASKRQAA